MSDSKNARLHTVLKCLCAFGGLFSLAADCNGTKTNGSFNPNGPTSTSDAVTQCCSASPPVGFIKVDDDWDPTQCGSPPSITRNMCSYQRYDNKAVGTTLKVCASASAPPGWVDGTKDWQPSKCGHPSSKTDNMKLITRAS